MDEIAKQIGQLGVIPVAVVEDESNAVPLVKALANGGLPCVEVTFRTAAAAAVIKAMSEERSDILVGAGTVLTVSQAERAIDSGARFIVSPGYDEDVVDYCLAKKVPCFPGCATPTEVMACLKKGLTAVKVFPVQQLGGVGFLKALGGPFTNVEFIPTGGVGVDNVTDYLQLKKVLACGGSWMVKSSLIADRAFDQIEELVAQAVNLVATVR